MLGMKMVWLGMRITFLFERLLWSFRLLLIWPDLEIGLGVENTGNQGVTLKAVGLI